jgi:hypothetical protein
MNKTTSQIYAALESRDAQGKASWIDPYINTVGKIDNEDEFTAAVRAWLGDKTSFGATTINKKVNYSDLFAAVQEYENEGVETAPESNAEALSEQEPEDPTIAELISAGYAAELYNLAAIAAIVRDWLADDVDPFTFESGNLLSFIAERHAIEKKPTRLVKTEDGWRAQSQEETK